MKKTRPGEFKEGQRYSLSSIVRCTEEVSLACFNAVLSQKKDKKYAGMSIKENVVIILHQGRWSPRHFGMVFIGLVLLKMQKIWLKNAMAVSDTASRFTCQLQVSRQF